MVKIKKKDWEKVIAHLQKGWPNEACGVLGGKDDSISNAFLLENISKKPRTKYEIDLNKILQITKELRQKDMSIIGVFHSHPESRAYPSKTDVELAFYPEYYYIIVSLKDRNHPDAHAFRIIDGKIEEHPIIIE